MSKRKKSSCSSCRVSLDAASRCRPRSGPACQNFYLHLHQPARKTIKQAARCLEGSRWLGPFAEDNRRIPGKDLDQEAVVRGERKKTITRPGSPWFRIIAPDSSKRCRPAKDRHACQEALGYLSRVRPISRDPEDSLGGLRIVSS